VLVLTGLFLVYGAVHKPKQVAYVEEAKVAGTTPFDNLKLGAKAVYVYDLLQHKVLFKKDEFVQLPLASLTKLMMALTAVELLPKNSEITINKEFLQEEGDTGLLVNESWKMKDLLDFSLVVSSNDGARSIASVAGAFDLQNADLDLGRKDFIRKMNLKAQELGLKHTYFVNENGLDIGDVSGGYGSAIDIATLMQYMLENEPDVLEATKYQSITVNSESETHTGTNTNIDIGKIPGLLASKTGFTDMAGGNLAVAFDASIGHPIIVVVLGSTLDGRFDDVSKLVDASFKYVEEQ
jgi:D-alanyl-D-alanine carboxypeptidase